MQRSLVSAIDDSEGVLFDLDGTLVDSLPDIVYAVRGMERAFDLRPVSDQDVKHWIGNGAEVLVRRVLTRDMNALYEGELTPYLSVFMDHYQHNPQKQTRLYPHALSVLQSLSAQHKKLALVTNKPKQVTQALLACLNLQAYFDVVLGGGDVIHPKPHPMMVQQACELLGLSPNQCLMVGDSENDVSAAKDAGMPVVAVEGGYNHGQSIAQSNPDWLIGDLSGLLIIDHS